MFRLKRANVLLSACILRKVEPTKEEESRPSQKQLEETRRRQGGQGGIHLKTDPDCVSPKQIEMAGDSHRPMLQVEWKGIS